MLLIHDPSALHSSVSFMRGTVMISWWAMLRGAGLIVLTWLHGLIVQQTHAVDPRPLGPPLFREFHAWYCIMISMVSYAERSRPYCQLAPACSKNSSSGRPPILMRSSASCAGGPYLKPFFSFFEKIFFCIRLCKLEKKIFLLFFDDSF